MPQLRLRCTDEDDREQWSKVCQKGCNDGRSVREKFDMAMEAALGGSSPGNGNGNGTAAAGQ